jgi:hypothetical protein
MAFIKVNVAGDKLQVDLDPQEQQYVKWAKDDQGVLRVLGDTVTLWLREQWAQLAGERMKFAVDADKTALSQILDRADVELKKPKPPVSQPQEPKA